MGHLKGISQRDSHLRVWMTSGRWVSVKSYRITWHSRWTPRLEKFLEKSWWAFSLWNWTWKGGMGRSEDKEDLEQKGFWVRLDLRLGTMRNLFEREGMRERNRTQSQQSTKKEKKGYVCMKYAWTCDLLKIIASWVQPNPNLPAHNFQHSSTHLNAWNIVKMLMKCNAWSYSI